jgi:glycosyltransferase involved in cell wall biosynthesis
MTNSSIFLNGRFLTQSVTGVQRFAIEIAGAIDRMMTRGDWVDTAILAPRLISSKRATGVSYQRLRLHEVGRTRGHLWEQTELPIAARGGTLINLGNTAPVLTAGRQVVVVHDVGVFDTPESYSFGFRAWHKTLLHILIRTRIEIVTVSEFSRQRILTRLGVDPARITVMYEGADHILRVPSDPGTLERFGLRPQKFALVVGSRAVHKNFNVLHEVGPILKRQGMMIAVAGDINPSVFQDNQPPSSIERRLGRVSDLELRALYEGAAFLLFPSRYEGFGLPPIEAMACGCPVIAFNQGAVREVCRDNALYFGDDEGQTVVDAVERLLEEDGVAEKLRAGGRARAAALSWESGAETLGKVVRRMD